MGFQAGLVIGLAGTLLVAAGLQVFKGAEGQQAAAATRHYSGTVRTSGATLSSRGGVKLVVFGNGETFTQECRGICDDLNIKSATALYAEYQAHLLNAHGNCVACAWEPAVVGPGKVSVTLVGGGIVQTGDD
jgi:hypothetical protein